MKTFKVKEVFTATGWTYIKANSLEEAQAKLENSSDTTYADFDMDGADLEHKRTDWNTLREDV